MTRKTLIVVAMVAVVALTLGFAANASAFPGGTWTGACNGCHSGAMAAPVATLVSNNGTTATFTVSAGGTEWALFNGSTRVTGAVGSTGQFAVPVPGTYTLFAVAGVTGGGTAQGLAQTSVVVAVPASYHTITASAGAHGAISPAGSLSATQGANVTYTFTPDSGYHIDVVTVDGVAVGGPTSYTFSNVQAPHTISVTFALGEGAAYTITATAGDHGSISPAGDHLVWSGGSVVYTMQPAEGYQVATITVDGVAVTKSGWYTFINVVATHTIDVTFKANPEGWFTITPYAGPHGQIWMAQQTVQGTSTIPGVSVPVSIMPDAHYHVSSLVIDGLPVPPATWYIFYNVRAGHTVEAEFAIDTYDIVATAGAHGTISPAGTQAAAWGSSATYSFTPASGYHISGLTVDGAAVAAASSYTFSDVKAAHTIAVAFAADTCDIVATAGAHGTISPSGTQAAAKGSNATYAFTPAAGYRVATVTIDGASVGAVPSYTFTNVQVAHTIAVTFVAKTPTATSIKASKRTVARRGYVTISGRVTGGVPVGTPVVLRVMRPGTGRYVTLKTVTTTAGGYWSYKARLGFRGKYYFRARFDGSAAFAGSSTASYVRVTVY